MKPTTKASYRTVATRYILPHVGGIELAKLSPTHVQTMMRSPETAGLSARTRQCARAVLRRALGHAERWEMVSRNAAALVEPP